jgi:LysM repeat protein
MSRCPARHAKTTSRYEGRHAKPGTPVSAALAGTAAKAVPASLVAAGSALVLSSPASAAIAAPPGLVHAGASDLAPVKTAAESTWVTRGRHAAPRPVYTVVSGDTLSSISARFCGTAADYKTLAAASGITDPDLIRAGQSIKLACHAHAPAQTTLLAFRKHVPHHHHAAPSGSGAAAQPSAPQPPAPQPQAPAASTAGMSAFESCVISRESGGDPTAYNPSSGAGGLFGFLPSTWASLGYGASYPGGAQTAPSGVQEAAFAKLYAEAGTAPWAPYDGC